MRIDRAALPFLIAETAIAAVAWAVAPWTALLPIGLLIFTLNFFRDPDRNVPQDTGLLVSPADGKIIVAGPDKISIFMNVFDVHVCRTPCAGRVTSVRHTSGRFLAAFKDEASDQNERAEIVLRGDGSDIRFRLVAGLVARRILTRVREGQVLAAGERIGLIRFGSRVDVDVPAAAVVTVQIGQRVVAGETVIARKESRPGPA